MSVALSEDSEGELISTDNVHFTSRNVIPIMLIAKALEVISILSVQSIKQV